MVFVSEKAEIGPGKTCLPPIASAKTQIRRRVPCVVCSGVLGVVSKV